MKETVEGIVLWETNYSETSKILNILTLEHGLIGVLSKGSRTIKSKLRGISMKLVYAKFTINYKENKLSTLIEGNLINTFKNIMTDFTKMNYANRCVNITWNVLKENNNNKVFLCLRDSLIKINEGFNPEVIYLILSLKLLNYLGVKPDFSNCINCGSDNILTFDLKIPGAICTNCYQDSYLFQVNTIKLLKLFQNIDISKLSKINITSKKVNEELEYFIKEYYDSYTGVYYNVK